MASPLCCGGEDGIADTAAITTSGFWMLQPDSENDFCRGPLSRTVLLLSFSNSATGLTGSLLSLVRRQMMACLFYHCGRAACA